MKNKAIPLLLSIFLPLGFAQAQSMDTLPNHHIGSYFNVSPETIMQTDDGSILGGFQLANITSGYIIFSEGYVLEKLTRHGAVITDTLFIKYKYFPSHFTGKNPFGSGNVHVEMGDFANQQSLLRIRFFDDHLVFDTTKIEVSLCENPIVGAKPGMLLNPEGDLVVAFHEYDGYVPGDVHFAQVGLDGTVKRHETYASQQIPVSGGTLYGPKVFGTSPLRYSCWCMDGSSLKCYVLDSLLNLCETYTIPALISNAPQLPHHEYSLRYDRSDVLGEEDDTFLVAAAYDNSGFVQGGSGMLLIRFDDEGNKLQFGVFPMPESAQAPNERPIGLEQGLDGCIYLCYMTSSNDDGTVCVMKLDHDMNVIWQRYCLGSGYGKENAFMKVLGDNGVAIVGNVYHGTEVFYVTINDDEFDQIAEPGIAIRPYAFYPNPTHDQLRLQYSPDVQPRQIELYDLQGRLVRTQRTGLESLDMSQLPAGTYTMRVTLEDGKVFSDKIMKQ